MKSIPLTRGYIASVDDADFDVVKGLRWTATSEKSGPVYAVHQWYEDGKRKSILMHRFLLDISDRKIKVDHRDHNGLNNTRINLRQCTHAQNMANRLKSKKSATPFKGVEFERNKWRGLAYKDGKKYHLGYFDTAEAAHAAVKTKSQELHGEFFHDGN